MLWELSWDVTYEMLNSADTSSLKAELKENPAKRSLPSFPLLSLREVVSTSVEPCSLEEQRETERWASCTLQNYRLYVYVYLFLFLHLDGDTGTWWGAGSCLSLLLSGLSELLVESSSQALHCTSSQVLCVPQLNYGSSHPWWTTISRSAFLLKSAAWKDLMLRSELLCFRCSS